MVLLIVCMTRPLTQAVLTSAPVSARPLHHYVFFGMDRESIPNARSFLETKAFEGAQVAYSWRQLEPTKDKYDFSLIREDLAFMKAHGKKLWIDIVDTAFNDRWKMVPEYLLKEPQYHGGVVRQYKFPNGDESRAVPLGWIARRWDTAVQERFQKLLLALGKQFDGRVVGVNLGESSADFGDSGKLYPEGYTAELYRDAIIAYMKVLKRAFPKSIALEYANFLSGDWQNRKGYLGAVYKAAQEMKVGVGGPDLLPYKPGQMTNSYPLIRESAGIVPIGIAFQDGNQEHINPKTGKRVTIPEVIDFATEYLKADYIFWCTEEPYFSDELVPFMRLLSRRY